MSKSRSQSKKGKMENRFQNVLEEGEIEEEDLFNISMECDTSLNLDDCHEFREEEIEKTEEDEQKIRTKKHRKRQRRKYKNARPTARKPRHKKRKSESISESNESPPSRKKKNNENYFQNKMRKTLLKSASRGNKSAKSSSKSHKGHRVSRVLHKKAKLMTCSSHGPGSSRSRTSSPFLQNDLRQIQTPSGSDSCYSDLEMQLKKCHEHRQSIPSRSGSKCDFLADDEHFMHQRSCDTFHPPDIRNSPSRQLRDMHYDDRERFRPDFPERSIGEHLDCEDRRRMFYEHPRAPGFHRSLEVITNQAMRDDVRCRSIHPHHEYPPNSKVSRDLDREPRWHISQKQDFDKIERSNIKHHQEKPRGPFPPNSPGEMNSQRHPGFEPSPQTDNRMLEKNVMSKQDFVPPQQDAGFRPTSDFHEKLAAHIREQNWMGASQLLFLRMASDRNPQTGMPPPFSMPVSAPVMAPVAGMMPIPDTRMIRPMPMGNFPSLHGILPMPPRPNGILSLPIHRGMTPMLAPVLRNIPPPTWIPPQLVMNQHEGVKLPPPLTSTPSITPGTKPNVINSDQKKVDSSSEEPKKDTISEEKEKSDSSAKDPDQNPGKTDDAISLDDPDVINMSSDSQKKEEEKNSTEKCSFTDEFQIKSKPTVILTEDEKSGDTWTYSSDEEDSSLFCKTTEVVSDSVQSIMQMISKTKNPNSNVDTHMLSKVVSAINFPHVPTALRHTPMSFNPSGVAAPNSQLTPNFQKGSGNNGSSIKLLLKKRRDPISELRKEPVIISLDEISKNNASNVTDLDPRLTQSRFLRKEPTQFSAALPSFGNKEQFSCAAKFKVENVKTEAKPQAGKEKLLIGADEKPNDPRVNRSSVKLKVPDLQAAISPGDDANSLFKPPQVVTPVALLKKPSSSLVATLPDLNLDMPVTCEDQTKMPHCFPPRRTREPPKLPKLVRGKTYPLDKNSNAETIYSSAHYCGSALCEEAVSFSENDRLAPRNFTDMDENYKKRFKSLPKLTPAPGYAARLQDNEGDGRS